MTVDVVNSENKKVGSVELSDAVFGGRVKTDLIHASVVRSNAAERRGTHATKNRANVSGSGKKPWRQKGTGRARVGEIRNPLWRGGGTVFGPQPRSYEVKTQAAAAMLRAIGVDGKALLVDVQPDERLALSVRNIPGVKFLASSRITARDVIDTARVVLTQSAIEKLQSALGA
jgi:large subunit ribosomal protein L4